MTHKSVRKIVLKFISSISFIYLFF